MSEVAPEVGSRVTVKPQMEGGNIKPGDTGTVWRVGKKQIFVHWEAVLWFMVMTLFE